MRMMIFISLMVFASCQSSIDKPKPNENSAKEKTIGEDPSEFADSPSDASQQEQAPKSKAELCEQAKTDWDSFRKKPQSCSSNNECISFGYYGDCDCSYGIAGVGPGGAGVAINSNSLAEAKLIQKMFRNNCENAKRCSFDAMPNDSMGCVNGECKLAPPSRCRP